MDDDELPEARDVNFDPDALPDSEYTIADHEFRDDDLYASAKYELTLRWLDATCTHDQSVVNMGCGAGGFSSMAIDAGYNVLSFEPDPTAHAAACTALPDSAVVENTGLFDTSLAAPADAIILHDVLEHIEDEAGAVDAVHDLLRPGGLAIISVPAMGWLFGYHDEQLGHFRRYSKSRLHHALSARFEVERLRYFGFTMIPITWWFSRFRRRPYPVGAVAGSSSLGTAMDIVCRVESRIPAPLGTSVLAIARRP
jgi:2-polyprenyl-3-methyl-5-hydroxy-6-metoxy-1,4-benzoquinol methylase